MPVTILVVSLALLMMGSGSFVMGISLTPTDMARAWLVVGATLFSGGMISLAIGFGVKALTQALARAGAPAAAVGNEAARTAEGAGTAEPDFAHEPVARAGIATPGMVAVGGAVLGAGAAVVSAQRSPAPADEFERDLFAPLPEASPAAAEARDAPALSELELRLSPAPAPVPEELALPVVEPEPELLAAASPREEDEAEVDHGDDEDFDPEEDHGTKVIEVPPAVPGLIADEDLAALQAEEAPLAPLETLDIVGAYDSGGVRFTMYSDGSVHAAGPGGEQRYRSLEALRKRLDAGLPAV